MPPVACLSADRRPTRRHRHCHKGPYAARWLNAAGGVPLAVRDGSATWVLLPELNSYLFHCKIELSQFLVNFVVYMFVASCLDSNSYYYN